MVISVFKHRVFLISFLLSHGSPLFMTTSWGMIANEDLSSTKQLSITSQSQRKIYLMDGLEAFEHGQFKQAAEIFTDLHSKGAMIPYAYLQYMKDKSLTKLVLPQESPLFEPIPAFGMKVSEEFLNASLAYIKCKDENTKSNLQKLSTLILNGNAHALSLMKKLCKDANVYKMLKTLNNFKKLKSVNDIQSMFKPKMDYPVPYLNCLDNDIICSLKNISNASKESFLNFEDEYNKGCNINEIVRNLRKKYPSHAFWAHVAIENGMVEECRTLARAYLDCALIGDGTKLKNEDSKKCVYISRYYMSKSLENDISIENDIDYVCTHADKYRQEKNEGNKIKERLYNKKLIPFVLKSQFIYALMLIDGQGGEKNIAEGLYHMEEAAHKGLWEAQNNLGFQYSQGVDIERDEVKATYYYRLGANQGNVIDQRTYAMRCFEGKGTKQDFAEARKYWKMAADQGDEQSMHDYASECFSGNNCPVNYSEALHYFQRAEKKGCTTGGSLFWCGWMCFHGKGTNKNLEIARSYFKRSAEQGYCNTQHSWPIFNYALMCYNGEGGPQDLEEAKKYFIIAAELGDGNAILALHLYFFQSLFEDNDEANSEEQTAEELNVDTDVVFQFPTLKSSDDSSDEGKGIVPTTDSQPSVLQESQLSFPSEVKAMPSFDKKEEVTTEEAAAKLRQELQECADKNVVEYSILRTKKRAQKEAAARTCHTLEIKQKDYDQATKYFKVDMISPLEKKADISYDTMAFVKTIFGQGDKKINTFDNKAAQQAFADLGCMVKNKKKENSTQISFALPGERIMKLKYHNPHGHGDENLYDDLKPHLKRFLQSIKKTPETLQVK